MSSASRHSTAEASLSAVGTSSIRPQPSQAERTADARKAFLSSFDVAAKEVDTDLQLRAKSIHSNAQSLTKQEKQLQDETKKLAKENQEMEKWLQKSQKKLAEFNDLMDFDLDGDGLEDSLEDLEAMLDIMEAKAKPGKDASRDLKGADKT